MLRGEKEIKTKKYRDLPIKELLGLYNGWVTYRVDEEQIKFSI